MRRQCLAAGRPDRCERRCRALPGEAGNAPARQCGRRGAECRHGGRRRAGRSGRAAAARRLHTAGGDPRAVQRPGIIDKHPGGP